MQFLSVLASALTLGGLSAATPTTAAAPAASAAAYTGDLLTFEVAKGWEYTVWGQTGKCINSPWPYDIDSISLWPATNIPACWVYATTGCEGSYVVVPNAGSTWKGPAKSFICDAPTS